MGAASVVALVTVAACASAGNSSGSGSKTIELGVITANEGPIAGAGKEFYDGGVVAAQEVNAGDLIGDGKKIELVAKEGSENPATSASVAAQLAANPSITGIVCCILSPVVEAVAPIAEKNKIPMDIWGATNSGLAQPPYVFRTVTMPQPANQALATRLAQDKAIKTVAYSVMTDNDGIVSQANAFKQGFNSAGVKSLGQVGILSTQTSFTSTATSLMQKSPDAIVVMATQSVELGVIAALHSEGYKGQVVAGETVAGAGVYKSEPTALANVPFPVYFLASSANSVGKKFVDDYQAKFGSQPDDYAAQGFIAVYTMAMALKAAGTNTTRAGLASALGSLTSLQNTIYGTITFSGGQLDASSSVKFVHYTPPNGDIEIWNGS